MRAAISSFNEIKKCKKIIILGDMLELGSSSKKEHKKIIKLLENFNFNQVLLVGEEFKKTNTSFLSFTSTTTLNKWIEENPIKETTILLKGSRIIKLENVQKML